MFKLLSEGKEHGYGKALYCHACHNVEARIARLCSGALIYSMWKDMPSEEKANFRKKYNELQGDALKEKLTVTMSQSIVSRDKV